MFYVEAGIRLKFPVFASGISFKWNRLLVPLCY